MQPPLATSSFQCLTKKAYFKELIERLNHTKSGDRALVTAMTLNPTEPMVHLLVDALVKAAKRGVTVDVAYDAYCYLINPQTKVPGPLYIWGSLPEKPTGLYAALDLMHKHIEQAGGHVAITNQPAHPRSNPFSGRSHIKTAIINDQIFIGGCNLNNIDDIDLMATFVHVPTANWLYDTMRTAIHAPAIWECLESNDQRYPIDPHTTLLLDAGIRNQSTVYDHALRFIDEAKEWLTITCQYFPNSTTATRLLAAHRRGVNVKIYYNHPHKHAGLHHKILQSMVNERERLRMPDDFFIHQLPRNNPFIHAKLLASEQGAIIGSHNYVKAGVQFGTAELALLRYDTEFGHVLVRAIEQQIAN